MGVSEILGGAVEKLVSADEGTQEVNSSPDLAGGKRRRRYRKKTHKKSKKHHKKSKKHHKKSHKKSHKKRGKSRRRR